MQVVIANGATVNPADSLTSLALSAEESPGVVSAGVVGGGGEELERVVVERGGGEGRR